MIYHTIDGVISAGVIVCLLVLLWWLSRPYKSKPEPRYCEPGHPRTARLTEREHFMAALLTNEERFELQITQISFRIYDHGYLIGYGETLLEAVDQAIEALASKDKHV